MNALDICAGSGIGSWVWERLGGQTVCYVEWDSYCQQILLNRMHDGQLWPAPIWDDLRTFDGKPWRGRVDFIFGGIPCQPWSVAGHQQGEADERDLWPDFLRVLCEAEPRFALVENVPGLLARGMGRILGELAESGYDAEWDCISASAVGAPHRRDRVWVVAYARGLRRDAGWPTESLQGPGAYGEARKDVADAPQFTYNGNKTNRSNSQPEPMQPGRRSCKADRDWWAVEPNVGRVAHGVPARVDRLKALGNAWVPQVAEVVMARIAAILKGADDG